MDCLVKQSDLKAALALVSRAVSRHGKMPMLQNVVLIAEGDTLRCEATDLEVGIAHRIPATVKEWGVIGVGAKLLRRTVALFSGDLRLQRYDEDDHVSLTVRMTRAGSTLDGAPFIESVTIPKRNDQPHDAPHWSVTFDAATLRAALDRVVFACSQETFRPELTTVCLEVEDTIARLVATDGYIMAVEHVPLAAEIDGDVTTTIPGRAMQLVARAFTSGPVTLRVFPEQQLAFWENDTTTVTAIAGKWTYPKWSGIYDQFTRDDTVIEVARAALVRAVDLALLYSEPRQPVVYCNVRSGWLTVRSAHSAHNLGESLIPVETDEIEWWAAFNPVYLRAILAHLPDPNLSIRLRGSEYQPIMLGRPDSDGGIIIMPVSVRGGIAKRDVGLAREEVAA